MSGANVCKDNACRRPLRNAGTREYCARCTERIESKARGVAQRAARTGKPKIAKARWKANRPVVIDRGEYVVHRVRINSFMFILSDRSLYFAHARAFDDGDKRNAPSIHRVNLQRGIA